MLLALTATASAQPPPARALQGRLVSHSGRQAAGYAGRGWVAGILACSGLWALVEKNGARGWWRLLCSNQVTNCS